MDFMHPVQQHPVQQLTFALLAHLFHGGRPVKRRLIAPHGSEMVNTVWLVSRLLSLHPHPPPRAREAPIPKLERCSWANDCF